MCAFAFQRELLLHSRGENEKRQKGKKKTKEISTIEKGIRFGFFVFFVLFMLSVYISLVFFSARAFSFLRISHDFADDAKADFV